jgi:hypothetical protein
MEKDMATVSFQETEDINTTAEMQGMELAITMNRKSNGEMNVHSKTGLVQKVVSNLEADGSIDVMGQSTPISVKGKTTINFSY